MSSGTLTGTDVFDKMVDSVACYERDGTIVFVNLAACRVFGRSRAELVGHNSWTSFAESEDALRQALERVARSGHTEQLASFDAESGRWYDRHVYLADGHVWVVSRDVTAERAASARLEILTNLSREFSEAASDSRTAFEQIARRVAEVPGTRAAYTDADLRLLEELADHLAGCVAVVTDVTERVRLEESKDEAGSVVYRPANVQDITARENNEATLRATIALRDEFLSIASHELRTPLTALSLQLDGLERSFERDGARVDLERARRKLTMAVRQTERLSALIDGLLDVSEVSVGNFWLEVEEFELNAMIEEVVSRFELESERVGSTITTRLGAMHPVRWDRSRMDQALSILLANALKYGGGKEIAVEASLEGERMSVSVRDRGIGIAEKEHERIFLRFERAVSSHHYGGFGLGLYIANQIVRAHSGSIRVQSRPGEGSVFTVSLPRLAPVLATEGSSLADRQMNARGT